MFKFMKKAIAVMTMGAMLIAPSTVFAAETNQDTTKDVVTEATEATARASSSFTMELKHNAASVVEIHNMGFNPTVRVTARGNANMTYKVWVVNPVGIIKVNTKITKKGKIKFTNLDNFLLYRIVKVFYFI